MNPALDSKEFQVHLEQLMENAVPREYAGNASESHMTLSSLKADTNFAASGVRSPNRMDLGSNVSRCLPQIVTETLSMIDRCQAVCHQSLVKEEDGNSRSKLCYVRPSPNTSHIVEHQLRSSGQKQLAKGNDHTDLGGIGMYSDSTSAGENIKAEMEKNGLQFTDNSDLPYLCTVCGDSFSQESELFTHVKTHGSITKASLLDNEIRTTTQPTSVVEQGASVVEQGASVASWGEIRPPAYTCTICDKQFLNRESGKRHERNHNRIQLKKTYFCTHCGQGFYHRTSWKRHETKHTGQRAYQCEECDKGYHTPSELSRHILAVHKQERVSCQYCSKQFSYPHYLLNHVKEKHLDLASQCDTHVCKVCNKGFPNATRLRRHEMVHGVDKPHKCTLCPRSYTAASSLAQHIDAYHSDSKYACDYCKKVFKYPQHLRSHVREKHNDEGNLVQCLYCEKKFPTSYRMRRHATTHLAEKPFQCEICCKGYGTRHDLSIHMQAVHNDEFKLACSFCGKLFKYSQHLCQHVKKIHGNNSNAGQDSESVEDY